MATAVVDRLKYVSRFARSLADEDIDAIVASSARNNALEGISGVLLAIGDVFLQILEGPAAGLSRVFERIEVDPRHRDVVVVRRSYSSSRLFPGWPMRRIELDDEARTRLFPVLRIIQSCARGSNQAGGRLYELDDEMWRVLGERSARSRARVA
jgi:hypothetical protein